MSVVLGKFTSFLQDHNTVSNLRYQLAGPGDIPDCLDEQRALINQLALAFRETEFGMLPTAKADVIDHLDILQAKAKEALKEALPPWNIRCNSHYRFKRVANSRFYERVVVNIFLEIIQPDTQEVLFRNQRRFALSEPIQVRVPQCQ